MKNPALILRTVYLAVSILFFIELKAQNINTVAGNGISGYSGDGSSAISASLKGPYCITVDKKGNIYFGDNSYHIRKVEGSTGIITTVANEICEGISTDSLGNVFFVNLVYVRKIDAITGIITTVAGNGNQSYSGDGGSAISAGMAPKDIAVDVSGNIYISDWAGNGRIRKIDHISGKINLIAGNGTSIYSEGVLAINTGTGVSNSITVDHSGNVYLHGGTYIRKIDATSGIISTIVNNFKTYYGNEKICVDNSGNIYYPTGINLANTSYTDCNVFKVDALTSVSSSIAGVGTGGFSGDGGLATLAKLKIPKALTIDLSGNIYIADSANDRIRMITYTSSISNMNNIMNNISFNPNPFSNSTTLKIREEIKGNLNLYIYNYLGEEVRNINLENKNEVTINKDQLKSGIYLFKLIQSNSEILTTGKLLIE